MLLTCVNAQEVRDNLTHLKKYSLITVWENTGHREVKVIDDNGQPFYFDSTRFMPTHFDTGMQFKTKGTSFVYEIVENKGDSVVMKRPNSRGEMFHFDIDEISKYFVFWPKVS